MNASLPAPAKFNFDAALARLDGNRDLFSALARMFYEDAVEIQASIREALPKNDWKQVAMAAHKLKSIAAIFDAHEVCHYAVRLEQLAQMSERSAVDAMLERLDMHLDAAHQALAPYREGSK